MKFNIKTIQLKEIQISDELFIRHEVGSEKVILCANILDEQGRAIIRKLIVEEKEIKPLTEALEFIRLSKNNFMLETDLNN